jgi:hypothetical protein
MRGGVREDHFEACSPAVAGSTVQSRVLVDAWMRNHDLGRTGSYGRTARSTSSTLSASPWTMHAATV